MIPTLAKHFTIYINVCSKLITFMPPFLLIVFLLVSVTFVTQVFVLFPLEFVRSFSVPSWLTLAVLALVLFWCFGE